MLSISFSLKQFFISVAISTQVASAPLRQVNQTHNLYRNHFSIFVLGWDVFKLIKNPIIKIKKQLTVTNFTLAMYKIAGKY